MTARSEVCEERHDKHNTIMEGRKKIIYKKEKFQKVPHNYTKHALDEGEKGYPITHPLHLWVCFFK